MDADPHCGPSLPSVATWTAAPPFVPPPSCSVVARIAAAAATASTITTMRVTGLRRLTLGAQDDGAPRRSAGPSRCRERSSRTIWASGQRGLRVSAELA